MSKNDKVTLGISISMVCQKLDLLLDLHLCSQHLMHLALCSKFTTNEFGPPTSPYSINFSTCSGCSLLLLSVSLFRVIVGIYIHVCQFQATSCSKHMSMSRWAKYREGIAEISQQTNKSANPALRTWASDPPNRLRSKDLVPSLAFPASPAAVPHMQKV